jgi:hypothetical protein
MPDYYFRGTLIDFWALIYAEYRLGQAQGREKFEIAEPNPRQCALAEFVPACCDQVCLLFWESGHRDYIVSVKATSVLDADLVNLDVDIYVTPYKRYGEAALENWHELKFFLMKRNLLLNPHAVLAAVPPKPSKPETGADLRIYFDLYHQMKKIGRNYTLKQIAQETKFDYSYVRKLHSKYLKER